MAVGNWHPGCCIRGFRTVVITCTYRRTQKESYIRNVDFDTTISENRVGLLTRVCPVVLRYSIFPISLNLQLVRLRPWRNPHTARVTSSFKLRAQCAGVCSIGVVHYFQRLPRCYV